MTIYKDIDTTLDRVARNEIPASAMNEYLAKSPGECMLALVSGADQGKARAALLTSNPELHSLIKSILKSGYAYFEQCPKPKPSEEYFHNYAAWRAWEPFDIAGQLEYNNTPRAEFVRKQCPEPDIPAAQRVNKMYIVAKYAELSKAAFLQKSILTLYKNFMDGGDLENCAALASHICEYPPMSDFLNSVAQEIHSRKLSTVGIAQIINSYAAWFGGDLSLDPNPSEWPAHIYPYASHICSALHKEEPNLLVDFPARSLGRFFSRAFESKEIDRLDNLLKLAVLKPENEGQQIVINGFCQALALQVYDERPDDARKLYNSFHASEGNIKWDYAEAPHYQSMLQSVRALIQTARLGFEDAIRHGAKCLGATFLQRLPAEFQENMTFSAALKVAGPCPPSL